METECNGMILFRGIQLLNRSPQIEIKVCVKPTAGTDPGFFLGGDAPLRNKVTDIMFLFFVFLTMLCYLCTKRNKGVVVVVDR